MGDYMKRQNQKKILYLAIIDPPIDGSHDDEIKSFVHKSTRPNENDGDGGGGERNKDIFDVKRLEYSGLKPGCEYKVEVSTIFDGKEVAETFLEFCTRPDPPRDLECKWGFNVDDAKVSYKAQLKWSGAGDSGETYLVEIMEGRRHKTFERSEPSLEYISLDEDEIGVRIWNVTEDGLKSERPLEEVLPPVPKLMSGYVRELERNISDRNAGSKYMYQVWHEIYQHAYKRFISTIIYSYVPGGVDEASVQGSTSPLHEHAGRGGQRGHRRRRYIFL